MPTTKKFLMATAVILCIAMSLVCLTKNIANAGKVCRLERTMVVRVGGDPEKKGGLIVDPINLEVNAGDCVVWVNWSKYNEIQVVFQEGKVCEDVVRSHKDFMPDARNCFVTNFIKYGETSSLTFKQKGTYSYVITTLDGQTVKCNIVVNLPSD